MDDFETQKEARRKELLETYPQVWNTEELKQDFEVLSFVYYMCYARRKSDGKKGLLEFDHSPRLYYGFEPE